MTHSVTIIGRYDSIEYARVPPWMAFQIDDRGNGNGRTFYLTIAGPSASFSITPSNKTNTLDITETDGASNQ